MGRSRREVIDGDTPDWTIREQLIVKDNNPPLPQKDFESPGKVPVFFGDHDGPVDLVFWGTGLISFGPVTGAQKAFMADLDTNADLDLFPGDYVACGFSPETFHKLEYGVKPGLIYVEWKDDAHVRGYFTITPDAISLSGGVAGGQFTGYRLGDAEFTASSSDATLLYLSDLDVTQGTTGDDSLVGSDKPESLLGLKGADTLLGGGYGDRLEGGVGADMLFGGDGDDRLFGGSGGDILFGRDGADTLDGGAGVLDWADYSRDQSVGVDLQSPNKNDGDAVGDSYIRIENLRGSSKQDTLAGDDAANQLEGLDGDDLLRGRKGSDSLAGGAGEDTLEGSGGADHFLLASKKAADADQINDFLAGADLIALDGAVFGLAPGALDPARLVNGAAAGDADDRLIFDSGALYFDPDGTGAKAQVLIAILFDVPALSASDFVLI